MLAATSPMFGFWQAPSPLHLAVHNRGVSAATGSGNALAAMGAHSAANASGVLFGLLT